MVAETTLTKERIMALEGDALDWMLAVHLFGWQEITDDAEVDRLNQLLQNSPPK